MPRTTPDRDASPLVLVIDDDQNTREAVQALLELDGYKVAVAGDGQEALDLLDNGLKPALILLDLNMPRMDGVTFRAEQRGRPAVADVPVIVCSGCREDEEDATKLGRVVFLHKPMPVDRLEDAVRRLCPLP